MTGAQHGPLAVCCKGEGEAFGRLNRTAGMWPTAFNYWRYRNTMIAATRGSVDVCRLQEARACTQAVTGGGSRMDSQTPGAAVLAAMARINRTWLERRPQDLSPLLHSDITLVLPDFAGRAKGRDAIVTGFADFCEATGGSRSK
jgi:hypothetical protein